MDRQDLIADLRILEELGLLELEVDDNGDPRWSPTEAGRAIDREDAPDGHDAPA